MSTKTTKTPTEAGLPLPPIVRPWVGKLHHSRHPHDDWGFLRDDDQNLIAVVKLPTYDEDELSKHRREGTDPAQARIDAILEAMYGPNTKATSKEGGQP